MLDLVIRGGRIFEGTGAPARDGAFADLVVFDPGVVVDTATYESPVQQPRGMPYVLVNGKLAVDDGRVTGARSGKVLRRGG